MSGAEPPTAEACSTLLVPDLTQQRPHPSVECPNLMRALLLLQAALCAALCCAASALPTCSLET